VEHATREVLASSLVRAVADRRKLAGLGGAKELQPALLAWIEGTLGQLVILAAEIEWSAAVERVLSGSEAG
jgi:hypothetical protein